MPRNLSLKIFASETDKVTTISDGGLFLDVSSIQMFDANGAAVTDAGVVVTVGVSADGVAYQSKVVSSDTSLGGFDFKYIKLSASGHTTAASVVVNLKVCSIDEAMSDRQYKGRLAELFTVKPCSAANLPDPVTLGVGSVVAVDGAVSICDGLSLSFPKSRTHTLTKNVIGRLKTYTTTALSTFTFAFELQCDSDCFQIGLPNIHTATVTGISASISVSNFVSKDNSASMVTPSTGVHVPVTWNGASTATLTPRAGSELSSFTFCDPIYLSTIPRLDGVAKPWLLVRLEVPSGTVISIPYNAAWNLELGTSGMPKVMYQSFAAGGVTTPGAITPSYSMEHTNIMIPAIRYASNKPAIQLMSVGDSTTQGLASNSAKSAPTDHGAVARAGYLKSTPQLPIECFNSAIHGQLPKVYAETINQHFSVVKPTHVFYSPYSINSVSTVLTDVIIKNNNGVMCRFVENLAGRAASVFILGGLPCNPAWKDLGATDSLRIAYNSYLKSLKIGFTYVDGYVEAYSGVVDGDGQMQIAAGFSSDHVHPNEDGYMALAAPVLPYIT